MSDTKSPEARSRNMAAIKCKDTKPEQYLRKTLFAEGYRYRKNVKYVFGHPDLYLSKYHTAVFINGCFWHRHESCKYAYMPKSRLDYWTEKFERNVNRDVLVRETLRKQNIKCLVIWECAIKKMRKDPEEKAKILKQIQVFFSGLDMYLEL